MKKKFLSLMMAAAVVASTSVSAFAATPTTTQGNTTIQAGTEEQDVQVGITGNILDNNGNVKPGTINVSVPTATSFSVNSAGELVSADMVITNNSDEKIKVIATGFKDPSGNQDIEVMKKKAFDEAGGKTSVARGKIWLKLTGGVKHIGLSSEGNGKMYDNDDNDVDVTERNGEIGELSANKSLTLKLVGEGGTHGSETNAIKDEFKLILKVKRDRQ